MTGKLRPFMRDSQDKRFAVEVVLRDGTTELYVMQISPRQALQWIAQLAEGVEYSGNTKPRA